MIKIKKADNTKKRKSEGGSKKKSEEGKKNEKKATARAYVAQWGPPTTREHACVWLGATS